MADFDEYDYLEKAVENPDLFKEPNGHSGKDEDENRSSKRRSEDDQDHRSKRSRGDDEHRSRRSDDREKEKTRERDRDRDRERDKDRDREREHRDRDKHRDRKERDRDREREKEREREREKEKDRERRSKERRSRERREKEKEREIPVEPEADPERDQRTVFAYQINLKADERDVYEFFSRAGKVRDVRLIMDRNSRRSKGVGYIEFYDVMSVPMAIALSGQLLLGQPVMVKPSEAEKNLVQPSPLPMMNALGNSGIYTGPYSGGARRLYVGNLHFNMNEEQLRQVFEPFGAVELVQLPTDPETGQCKGFGFVQYAKLEDARAAQQNLNGLELAGRPIKVTAVTEQTNIQDPGPEVSKGDLDDDEGGLSLNARSRAELMQKLDRSGLASSAASVSSIAPTIPPTLNAQGITVPGLGIPGAASLSAVASILRPGILGLPGVPSLPIPGIANPAAVLGSSVLANPLGVPSDCLLLTNMFDPSEWNEEFEEDLKEDVKDECSKYGSVLHIYGDGKSAGHVYVKFDSINSAAAAQRALHGRWFAGKSISATFLAPEAYKVKFPDS